MMNLYFKVMATDLAKYENFVSSIKPRCCRYICGKVVPRFNPDLH